MTIVSGRPKESLLENFEALPVVIRPLLRKNFEVVSFIAKEATGFVVPYSLELDARSFSAVSFPSKLLEFARTGVPGLIVAPSSSAVGQWAIATDWPAFASDAGSKLANLLSKFSNRESWYELANKIEQISARHFNPDVIHAQLVEQLDLNQS